MTGQELCDELMQFQATVILMAEICDGAAFIEPLAQANKSQSFEKLTHNVFAISATSPGEKAGENKDGGYLSTAIFKCFEDPKADLDRNGVIYLDEVYQYTTEAIKKQGYGRQNPMAFSPATLSNIPLIQIGDKFEYPSKEIPLSGHIEDDRVIASILARYKPSATR